MRLGADKHAEGTRADVRKRSRFFAAALIVAVFIAYFPAWQGGFVWDDDTHISQNQTLRSLDGLRRIWFEPGATCQYYPLTFTAWWVGHQLWGLNPLGYHLLSILFHGVAAVLFWRVLLRLRVRGAGLAAILFALHPVCVMSVAWMTELKNTLSATLVLGAALGYLRFAGIAGPEAGGSAAASRRWRYYGVTLLLFALGLLAKTAVGFLPVTLFLITWWRKPRLRWTDLWPLLPMLAMATGIGVLTRHVELETGAVGEIFNLSFLERVLISGRSFWFYLGKLLWPHPLIFIYPRWEIDAGAWGQYLYPAATVGLLAGLWILRRRIGKGPLVAFLHFYLTTSALILVHVLYMTRYSYVADHWQYYGCMSLLALTAAGLASAFDRMAWASQSLRRVAVGVLALGLGMLTWQQSRTYTDVETFYRTTLARNPTCWLALNNLGMVLLDRGLVNDAIVCYRETLRINPSFFEAYHNLGNALFDQGLVDEAVVCYRNALKINPFFDEAYNNLGRALIKRGDYTNAIACYRNAIKINPCLALAHSNLGQALARGGQVEDAIAHFRTALRINPNFAEAYNGLGIALAGRGQMEDAIANFQMALRINPHFAEPQNNLGNAFFKCGKFEEALAAYQHALEIDPTFADAHNNLGMALYQGGRVADAVMHLRETVRLQPRNVAASTRLAWILATTMDDSVRNGPNAIELAKRVILMSNDEDPLVLDTLAAAYAEDRQYSIAAETAQRAQLMASSLGRMPLANAIQERADLYKRCHPFREARSVRPHSVNP